MTDTKTDAVKLFKGTQLNGGVWPSEMAAYYDKLDDERGFSRAKLCLGYGWKASFWEAALKANSK